MPEPIRILHVVFSLDPGGMENGIVNVTNQLPPEFVVEMACLERAGAFAERLKPGVGVHVLGKASGFQWRAVRWLRGLIKECGPHIVHTHNLGPLIYGGLAAFGNKVKILQGEHAQLTAAERTPRRMFQRRVLYSRCARIHTVATEQLEELVGAGFPARKIVAIVNGVDNVRFAPGQRAVVRRALGLPVDAEIIGMVGRFGPFKRHDALLEAFAAIASQRPGSFLVLVGDGGPRRESVLAQIEAHPFRERIRWAGFQDNPVPWYQSFDVLAVPSVNEGMSNAVLEAMACGVAVVAHAACGHAEILGKAEAGVLADLSSEVELVKALVGMLDRPDDTVKLGLAARDVVCRGYSLEGMCDAYARCYRELVAG